MKFIQRASLYMTPEQRAEIEGLGIATPKGIKLGGDVPLVAFDVAEDHPNFALLCVRLQQWGVKPRLVGTEFTSRELDEARWLQVYAWENGFILPREDRKFVDLTYDMTNACHCGVGKVQKAPIRIKMEPKWGRKGIMSLNGAYDEFFVSPAVWETLFKPFGVQCGPVLNRNGKQLETVVQLLFDERVDIVTDGLSVNEICKDCKTVKYGVPIRGRFPSIVQEPGGAIVRTRQAFGCGWTTYAILISQNLRQAMLAHNIRGAEFIPVDHALPAVVA